MSAEFLSITEAARALSEQGDQIDRSTLSRYLKQHGEAGLTTSDNLVDFGRLVAHRQENIRLRNRASGQRPVTARPQVRGNSGSGHSFAGTQSDAAARDKMAVAEMREMDLAARRKELTIVSEVDQAGRDAVKLMMSAFERAIDTEASAWSMKYGWDERTVRIALKEFSRMGLGVFNREVLLRLDAMKRDADTGEPITDPGEAEFALQ